MKKLALALALLTTPALAHHDGWVHYFSNADVKAIDISTYGNVWTFWFRYTDFDPIVYQKVFLDCDAHTYTVQTETGQVLIDSQPITPSMSLWDWYQYTCSF